MRISEQEKKKRVDLAMMYAEVMALFFELVIAQQMAKEELVRWLDERMNIVADNYIKTENLAYVNDWSKREAEKVVDDTLKHVNDEPEYTVTKTDNGDIASEEKTFDFKDFDVTIPQSEYWTSDIRATLIGIECASAIANYGDLYDAMNRGMTNKVWITEGDDRVRKTHVQAEGQDIPITDLFLVGNSHLMFPGDISNGADSEETVNCRCHLTFYKK